MFAHPHVREGNPLIVRTGADAIKWSYTLNTASWPTYAGEVVQILSVAIDDVTIIGTLHSYEEMENIYSYFLEYIQIASQGKGADPKAGTTAYNQLPMTMRYPARNWTMRVIPKTLPGFRKGRDVVAPQWRVQAHIVDDYADVEELKNLVLEGVSVQGEDFELTGEIGYNPHNPWSDPFPENKGRVDFDPDKTREVWNHYGDYFSKIIPSWLENDFSSITSQFGAKPAFLQGWGRGSSSEDGTPEQEQRAEGNRQGD